MSTDYADINLANKVSERVAILGRMGIKPEHMVSTLVGEFNLVPVAAANYVARFAQR